jgi:alpha-L-rhamnosidase
MYSDFMSWMMKTLVGINITKPGYGEVEIKPEFVPELDFCKGHIDSHRGRVSVEWKRSGGGIALEITVPENIRAVYQGSTLKQGKNIFNGI